jgi:hypothetical protein
MYVILRRATICPAVYINNVLVYVVYCYVVHVLLFAYFLYNLNTYVNTMHHTRNGHMIVNAYGYRTMHTAFPACGMSVMLRYILSKIKNRNTLYAVYHNVII